MILSPYLHSLADAFGLAILHSFWQIGFIALFVYLLTKGIRGLTARANYRLQFTALLFSALAFFITFSLVYVAPVITEPVAANLANDCDEVVQSALLTTTELGVAPPFTFSSVTEMIFTQLTTNTITISLIWLIGVLFYSLIYARAIRQLRQLRHSAETGLPAEWQQRFAAIVDRTGIRRHVQLGYSALVQNPLTIGHLKPIILLPTGLLLQLPTDQIEAILLHELGHIRRYDYLANLIQSGLKTLFFYHPGIHFMCRKIDQERENACDDFAVGFTNNPTVLVRALSALTLKSWLPNPTLALHISHPNYPIVDRLHRLLHPEKPKTAMNASRFLLPFCLLLCFGLFVAAANGPAKVNIPDCDPIAAAPDENVVELLPYQPIPYLPTAPIPAFAQPELRHFAQDTVPPSATQEKTLIEAQMARLKAAEERLKARERKLALLEERLENEARKMDARSKEAEAEEKRSSAVDKKDKVVSSSSTISTTTSTATGKHTEVVTSGMREKDHENGSDYIGYVRNQGDADDTESVSLCTEKIVCLRNKLTSMLVADDLIESCNSSAELSLYPGKISLNDKPLPAAYQAKYAKVFREYSVKSKKGRVVIIKGKNIGVGDMQRSRGVKKPYLVGTYYSETK